MYLDRFQSAGRNPRAFQKNAQHTIPTLRPAFFVVFLSFTLLSAARAANCVFCVPRCARGGGGMGGCTAHSSAKAFLPLALPALSFSLSSPFLSFSVFSSPLIQEKDSPPTTYIFNISSLVRFSGRSLFFPAKNT
jgi:hypothetical protein